MYDKNIKIDFTSYEYSLVYKPSWVVVVVVFFFMFTNKTVNYKTS